MGDLEQRYRERSLWLDQIDSRLTPRPTLAGDVMCDVAIVGAGFTGLWTAYYLKQLQPDLRITVVEAEVAGFGASGRNGGWASAGPAGVAARYERTHGRDAVARLERATFAAVDEIGRVAAAEGIDCGFAKGGVLQTATTPAQLERMRSYIARRHRYVTADDIHELRRGEVRERVRVEGVLGAAYSPHGARIQPARLARGLADAVERLGVAIHERTAARTIEPHVVRCDGGTVRADTVVRATEAWTPLLPGERRTYLPLYSLMIATEPLAASVWDELGWAGNETVADFRHLFFYAQRTTDDRIAIGGRGAPYRLGAPVRERYERRPEVKARLEATIRRHFPAAAGAAVTHHWGGPLGVPRDWCQSVRHDPATGLAAAGGYSGHGVVAANLSGQTLADLILRRDSDLVQLPFVGHRSRSWEPEPLRFVACRAIVSVMASADRAEEHAGSTARRMRLIQPFVAGRA